MFKYNLKKKPKNSLALPVNYNFYLFICTLPFQNKNLKLLKYIFTYILKKKYI